MNRKINIDINKKNTIHTEGTDSNNNNSDIWFHTNCTEMMKDDEKTTKNLVEFLNSIGYELPDVEIIGEGNR